MIGHTSDLCPQVKNVVIPDVNIIDCFQRKYDPYNNTYNLGWWDHPNFKWRNQGHEDNRAQDQLSLSALGMSLQDIVKSLADHSLKFQ